MEQITLTHKILGPCMDVKTDGNRLFAIQAPPYYPGGRLCVLDKEGTVIGEYVGLGTARQIEIKNGIAVVSARSNNLWIFDITQDTPRLLSHYKTIEYAVGVTLYANLALISCRQYGIEVIDISDPSHPQHIRTIQTGEVQSACVYNDILYGGIWGTMKVLVVDIHDLESPRILADIPLQGRGDGVVVKDNILYAVTGQHKRGLKNDQDHGDPCFGMGNGVEMYDVSNPAQPKFLARQEFGYGYSRGLDMWDANISGDLVLCNDSVCGVHILHAKTFEPICHLGFKEDTIAATGLTTMQGRLYVSSSDGLYSYDGYPFADLFHADTEKYFFGNGESFACESSMLIQRFVSKAPVLSVCQTSDGYALACANDGIRLLDRDFRERIHCDTHGMCCEVRVYRELVFAAMAEQGLIIYRRTEDTLTPVAQYRFEEPLLQIDLSESGKYINCCCGEAFITLLDVSDLSNIRQLARRDRVLGNIYGSNYLAGRLSDGSMGMFWHHDGLFLTNPDHGDFSYHQYDYARHVSFMGYGPENGCDTDGQRIFYNLGRQLVVLPLQNCNADDLPHYAADRPIDGKLTYHDNRIYAIERAKGLVQVYDIHDLGHIKTEAYFHTNASCEKAVIINDRIFIPGWYGGLLELI